MDMANLEYRDKICQNFRRVKQPVVDISGVDMDQIPRDCGSGGASVWGITGT
jgi:hypothetical protein